MSNQLESLGRLRLQGMLLIGVVFVIGALAGVAFERARESRPRPPHPAPHGDAMPPWLRNELRLTEEQAERVHEILEAHKAPTDAVLQEFLPRLRVVADSIRAEVRAILTPEQQEIFDRHQPPLGEHRPGVHPGFGEGHPRGAPPRGGRRPPDAPPLHGGPPPNGGSPPHGAPPRGSPPHHDTPPADAND
ncbi:MAG: periplasmic heavy metal sensor [Candidatus Eisenbacteria bacterium]|nr:periplasmic heavy metal sensor [Candidatus Eisenbacteria bacterium]